MHRPVDLSAIRPSDDGSAENFWASFDSSQGITVSPDHVLGAVSCAVAAWTRVTNSSHAVGVLVTATSSSSLKAIEWWAQPLNGDLI